MNKHEADKFRDRASGLLKKAGIVITSEEMWGMEIADCGFHDMEHLGLQIVVYENNERYCAKEIILLPRQMFPEHRHPPIDDLNAGKQETFRCRWGTLYLYVEGDPTPDPKAHVPEIYGRYLTVWKEVVLRPGEQCTLPPDTLHWFQAGDEGCVVSEFSSTSNDETDIFTDPRVRRLPVMED
ncbi:MAG: D-lyxose/D-mannose family sugar isomerase [Acidobacteria bacterium]|nr:D-lyxose/D-mannose family sugar isomerase [Acidobacteriota bacterium]MBU1475675.1 D-lyxose/D-mannose family sugar isomerase [Acidobacteriota bacterium]MBU4202618.1 D-lyxose/D-mannose family sugar isomerase [Acidobacteriota bacterium]MBU4330512.1 D-lyxose/D-mannose family sugar isomerase [Acidobacteriota bacterium]MCG2816112.1 D-lyxose/D-mannose family sugar isomerase [Candidatus Aminicenantes bacterium]